MLTSRANGTSNSSTNFFSRLNRMLHQTTTSSHSINSSTHSRRLLLGGFILVVIFITSLLGGSWFKCTQWPTSTSSTELFDESRELHLRPTHLTSLEPSPHAALDHLILVAGHAVLTSLDVHDLSSPENWSLLDYQRDQVGTFIEHIRVGVELTRADPNALLIFSGGETRREAGPRSEAQSYWMAAEHENWWRKDETVRAAATASSTEEESLVSPLTPSESTSSMSTSTSSLSSPPPIDDVPSRSTTEEYARDSFENLLFSLCRFYEMTGHYPSRVTVVGFGFKRARFQELHRAAVRFPSEKFAYQGVDPPGANSGEDDGSSTSTSTSPGDMKARQRYQALLTAELEKSVKPFRSDPYSCLPDGVLLAKKLKRNPFRRHPPYQASCPQMSHLLQWCQKEIFTGELPWTEDRRTEGNLENRSMTL